MHTCPECGEEYSPQGMFGHLSMGHGLNGEELEEAYQRAQDEEKAAAEPASPEANTEEEPQGQKPDGKKDERSIPLPDPPTRSGREETPTQEYEKKRKGKDVGRALDRLRRARERLRIAEGKTGEEVKRKTAKGGVISSLFGRTKTETVVERTEAEKELCEQCREEVADAEKKLQRALEKR